MSTPTTSHGAAGRAAFHRKFDSPAEKSTYFSELAKRSHANRLTLNSEEREALASAYALIHSIAARHGLAEGEADGE